MRDPEGLGCPHCRFPVADAKPHTLFSRGRTRRDDTMYWDQKTFVCSNCGKQFEDSEAVSLARSVAK